MRNLEDKKIVDIDDFIANIYRKDFDTLIRLLDEGADVDMLDEDGRTPLIHAVLAEDADANMINFLISKGANPNASTAGQKWSVLHFAARDQSVSIVETLLMAGAEVDSTDIFGNTPLWRCVMAPSANKDVADLLILNGADPSKKNKSGVSPKELAERMGKTAIVPI